MSEPRSLAALCKRGTLGVAGTVLAALACYGTLALAALLPLFGLRLSVNPAAWSVTILLLALLAVAAILPGFRRHRSPVPALTALVGGALIAYALLVRYEPLVELAGFTLLAAAALDGRRRRTAATRTARARNHDPGRVSPRPG